MVQICYESIMSSSLMPFLVGPDERPFTLHSGAIRHWFPSLIVWPSSETLYDNCSETLLGYRPEQGVYAWQHIDVATFSRFAEFVYTGDYQAPSPTVVVCKKTTTQLLKYRNWFSMAAYAHFRVGNPDTTLAALDRDALWTLYKALNYTESTGYDKETIQVQPNTGPHQCYVDVLRCHVNLYALAQEHSLKPLMRETLDRLHQTLIHFKFFDERVGDIVGLLTLCYENEHASGIRDVVVHYAACHAEQLWSHRAFVDLVGSNTELSQNFITAIMNYWP